MYDDAAEKDSEAGQAFLEVLRQEAILAELDPDRLGPEPPPDVPDDEWAEFVALCDHLDADG